MTSKIVFFRLLTISMWFLVDTEQWFGADVMLGDKIRMLKQSGDAGPWLKGCPEQTIKEVSEGNLIIVHGNQITWTLFRYH